MIPFIVTTLFTFLLYLVLTAGAGDLVWWSYSEIAAGIVLSLITAALSRTFFCRNRDYRMANPVRLIVLLFYIVCPFFIEMAKANLDVAYRVITGRIRPGIVRISPGLKTDFGVALLANSITLTPGTLTVSVDDDTGDFYVHMINIRKGLETKKITESEDVFTLFQFPAWIRRIAE